MTMIQGAPLTPEQQKLCAVNIARLQAQAVFGHETPPQREPPSLLDLAEPTCSVKSAATIPFQRIL